MKNNTGSKFRNQTIKKFYKAITENRVTEFYYVDKYQKSKNKKDEGVRKGEAYLIGINEQGNLFISGVFTRVQENNNENSVHKNYLIDQIKKGSLKILPEKFDHLKIDPEKVYCLKKATVLCAVYFPDEIAKAYKK